MFDWKAEFPDIMKSGGFDAVIGNPPYGAQFQENAKFYFRDRYKTWSGESYLLFVEKGTTLLRLEGLFGYIIPDTYLNLAFTQSLRSFILQNTRIQEIVSLPSKVFINATVDTTLLFTEKALFSSTPHDNKVLIKTFNKKTIVSSIENPERSFLVSSETWHEQKAFNIQSDDVESQLISRIEQKFDPLANLAEMFSGIKAYEVGKGSPPQTEEIRNKKPFTSKTQSNKNFLPFFDGKHIGRYYLLWNQNNWINYGPWLAAPRNAENFKDGKILIRKIVNNTLIATYIPETSYCNTLLHLLKIKPEKDTSYPFLLGILNSRFIGWYFRKKFQISFEDTFPQIMIRDILQFPIPSLDKARHDRMVEMVEQMLP